APVGPRRGPRELGAHLLGRRRAARAHHPAGGGDGDDDRRAQRAREFHRRGRRARPGAGDRDQRLSTYRRRVAHDRPPRLARADSGAAGAAAGRSAEVPALSFSSPWWLPGGHLQTIVPSLFPPPRVPLRRERWDTPDGDFIDVDFCGDPGAETQLVLFHGLEGGSDSHYARAIAAHAVLHGWRLAMPHFRGCSGEPNRTRRAYHSGDSAEIDWMLRRLGGPLCAMGVSLGGNVLLKWLGERGDAARALVRRAAAVSAPLDFGAAGDALDRG